MAKPTSVSSQITDAATLEHLGSATRRKLPAKSDPDAGSGHGGGGHGGSGQGEHTTTSVREASHKGRKIRIETTYSITVDGEPIGGHVMVEDDGKVHYHSIPNQEFRSAIDMVKRLIDLIPPGLSAKPAAYGEAEE